jgi:Cu-Zn family superoxide dismutase
MSKPIRAICVFHPQICNGISGTVVFTELIKSNQTKKRIVEALPYKRRVLSAQRNQKTPLVEITIELDGVPPGVHGFHIHETGNMLDKCISCKAHFNPFSEVHGGLKSKHRHVGDLGNITANPDGKVRMKLHDTMIQLRGDKSNIIGRSLVIHEKEDDLGLTPNNPESLINGLAGARIACAVVGYADAYYF